MIKGTIDSYELWQSRPENLNENMEDEIKAAENRGWNQCNRSWIKTIEEQPRVGEWIPCGERLPEKSGKYLGQRPHGDIIDIEFSKKHQKWNAHDSYPPEHAMEIVAWMPLPEQYKAGDQE